MPRILFCVSWNDFVIYSRQVNVYILLQSKFDDNTQEFGFVMGIDGSPLYQPITKEGTKGDPNEFTFVDEDTYEVSKISHIPVSFPVIEADYASLATITQDQKD